MSKINQNQKWTSNFLEIKKHFEKYVFSKNIQDDEIAYLMILIENVINIGKELGFPVISIHTYSNASWSLHPITKSMLPSHILGFLNLDNKNYEYHFSGYHSLPSRKYV